MAGDWIKMRSDLHTHPKVVRISSALKADRLRVIGALHAVWCLFDAHSVDGSLDGYTAESLDELIGWSGFSNAMKAVNWLEECGDVLVTPRFAEHNGQSAKRRAQETERKRTVRNTSAPEADKKRTREEKRRDNPISLFVDETNAILSHLNAKTKSNFQSVASNQKLIRARLAEGYTVEQLCAVVDAKVAEWTGDPKMEKYLRPATLFNAEKFAQYAGAAQADSVLTRLREKYGPAVRKSGDCYYCPTRQQRFDESGTPLVSV